MGFLIDLEHIVDAQNSFMRPYREGKQAIENLVVVGKTSKPGNIVDVVALCIRCTSIHEDPVTINVKIDKTTSEVKEKIKNIDCSCPSGASKEHLCKHAMATLIYLERRQEEELEFLTCTDVEQKWGNMKKAAMSKFDPTPLAKFCYVEKPKTIYKSPIMRMTTELELEFRSLMMGDEQESEASVFMSGVRYDPTAAVDVPLENDEPTDENSAVVQEIAEIALGTTSYILKLASELGAKFLEECTPAEKEYYNNNVKISEDVAVKLCVDTSNQNNVIWEAARYGRITGSICYALYTYSKNKAAKWDSKLQGIFNSSFQGNEDTEQGLMYEDDARECYEKLLDGYKIIKIGFLVSQHAPWFGYSADGIICDGQQSIRLWECKTPKCGVDIDAVSVQPLIKWLKDGKLKCKHKFYGQIQMGMLLNNLQTCDFINYSCGSDQVLVDTVTFNDAFCTAKVVTYKYLL